MSERLIDYLYDVPGRVVRDLLVEMCTRDPFVRDRTRHWINTLALEKQEAQIQREADAAAEFQRQAAAAPSYHGYSTNVNNNNVNINGTFIVGNTNCSINGVSYSSSMYSNISVNPTIIAGNASCYVNGVPVHSHSHNRVTVNGRTIPLSNGPPPNLKRRAVEDRHAAPSPKRMAVGADRRQEPVPVPRQDPVPARAPERIPVRVPERRQVRAPEPVIPEIRVKREAIPNVKTKREPTIPAVQPQRESSIPEVIKTEPVVARQVRIKLIKTEPPRDPTPSPPRRKSVRIKTEPTVIPASSSSVSVCDMCEKRYREVANSEKACRYHPASGYLALDDRSDEWMDWYHEDGDLPDTDEGRRQYPGGFEWTCCRRDGTGEACTVARHVERGAGVGPRRRPNAMILAMDREGELARVGAVDWR